MKISVYGTLRKDMYNYNLYLKGTSKYIGTGYVIGKLYTIKDVVYPALVPGDKLIVGEIYEVEDHILSKVDQMESYYGNNDLRNRRTIIAFFLSIVFWLPGILYAIDVILDQKWFYDKLDPKSANN